MKTVKIVSIVASSILLLILTFALNVEDPLKANYRRTLENIMESENLNSDREVLEKYQYLRNVKMAIAKADQLRTQIASITSGPAPTITKAEMSRIEQMELELMQFRLNAHRLLKKTNANESLAVAL